MTTVCIASASEMPKLSAIILDNDEMALLSLILPTGCNQAKFMPIGLMTATYPVYIISFVALALLM